MEANKYDSEETPQHRHRKKLIKQDAERKARTTVEERWLEVLPDKMHKKGGKVSLVKKLTNGNKYRIYLGREKAEGMSATIAKYKQDGLRVEKV